MIEGVDHTHVPNDASALAPVQGFGELEVRAVGFEVAQYVASRVSIGSAVEDLRFIGIGDEVDLVRLDYRCSGASAWIQSAEVEEGRRIYRRESGLVADRRIGDVVNLEARQQASIGFIDSDSTDWSGRIAQEWPGGFEAAVERAVEAVIERVVGTRGRAQESLHWGIGLSRLQDVTTRDGPSAKHVAENAMLSSEARDVFVEGDSPSIREI